MNITTIKARQILDSRGTPTVEADVYLSDGTFGRASVPSGASTGSGEALELRDGGTAYDGKGVTKAVQNIVQQIAPALMSYDVTDQAKIDHCMLDLDGSENKASLGANAILAVSLACAAAAAKTKNMPLYQHIGDLAGNSTFTLPMPMMNIINGGQHAAGSTDIQEFMIIPTTGKTFADRLRMGAEVFQALKKELSTRSFATTVGDEGGFAPALTRGNREALEIIATAVGHTSYVLGTDIHFALDVAASELLHDGAYTLATEQRSCTSQELISWYQELCQEFPIVSIEDGLGENDWDGWKVLTATLGDKLQLVGDDLLVTNTNLLQKAITNKAANAILIKPNQIGSLTETIAAVQMAQAAGWKTIISHRSGETEDTTIAHLSVGLNTGQIKTGSLSRSERLAKYNELLRIEEQLL